MKSLLRLLVVFVVSTMLCVLMSASCSTDENITDEPNMPGDNNSTLQFVENGGTYGIEIRNADGEKLASQPFPAVVRIKNNSTGVETILKSGYQDVAESQNGYSCRATITSPGGSQFLIIDNITVVEPLLFTVKRNVKVEKAAGTDKGFSSQFSLISAASGYGFNRFDLFAPGFLYRTNTYNNPYESNPDLGSGSFSFKEMKYGLPLFMAHSVSNGHTIALSHVNPKVSSGIDEKSSSTQWVVSPTVKYGSLGAEMKDGRLHINFAYPSVAADAPRSHPVKVGQTQSYTLAISAGVEKEFTSAAVDSYKRHYMLNKIDLFDVDIKDAYTAQMDMFAALAAPIVGNSGKVAYGLPWSISIPDGKPHAFELQNGFVGRQTSIAYQLMRYGKQKASDEIFRKGLEMAKFWFSDEQLVECGLPRSWWIQTEKIDGYNNKYIGDFWTYPSFTRCFTDGMEGLLDCVRLAEAYSIPEVEEWAAIIHKFGEFLLNAETAGDGSFYRAYQKDGKYLRDVNAIGPWESEQKKIQASSKTNTLIPVRLLIRLYEWSGDKRYLDRAVKAGEYGYKNFFQELGTFIGGTPDNSNVVDKEAGVYAMYAFTALYQATGDRKWLSAAEYAAIFAFSYTYCYDFAIQGDDAANIFREGGITGYSLISAGAKGTDNFNANIYYELFKLSVLTEDEFYTRAAKQLERNTKRPMDLDGTKGYAYKALLLEATTLCDLTFSSVSSWLPWCGVANGEPMVNFYQTFGAYNISDVESRSNQSLLDDINSIGAGGKKYVIR